MSTSVLKALPGKLDIKRHSPSILYIWSIKLSYDFHIHHSKHMFWVLFFQVPKTHVSDKNYENYSVVTTSSLEACPLHKDLF